MNATYKICIYLKGREKPIILTDIATEDNPYKDTVEFFHESIDTTENKIVTLNFANDNMILNLQNIECVVVSKPVLSEADTINAIDEDEDIKKINEETIEDIVTTEETPTIESNEDDEVFNNDSDDITVVED